MYFSTEIAIKTNAMTKEYSCMTQHVLMALYKKSLS